MADGYINGSSSSGGSVTIAANTGYAISNVSFTYTENKSNRVGGSPTVSPDTHYQYSISSTTGTISLKAGGTAQQSVTFTTTDKCRISAMTVTYSAVVTDSYDIHIGKNNADYTDQSLTNTSGTTWSKTVTLDGSSYYEFKVKKTPAAGDAVWYGNAGKITATTSPAWDFSSGVGSNCKLYTAAAGSYTFSWDASTNKLSITYPAGDHPTKRVYMACGSTTWCDDSPKFFVHSWGVLDYNTQVQQNACNEYYADIIWYNDYFQFTRNSSEATAYNDQNWNYSQNLTYNSSELLWTCTGWSDDKGNFSSSAYSPITYTITFAGNGGSGSMSAIENICSNADQAITSNSFTKTGYDFAGWTANVDVTISSSTVAAGTIIANGATIQNITSDITLTAQWTAKTATITLDNQSATTAGATSVTATYGSAMPSIAANLPAKTGYTFGGYYTATAGGGTQYYAADGTSTRSSSFTAASTLYAKWTQTITLNPGTQGSGSKSPTITYNGTTLTGFTAHTADGYELSGYYTAASEGTKVLNADGTFAAATVTDYITASKWTHAGATTLYAQWEKICTETYFSATTTATDIIDIDAKTSDLTLTLATHNTTVTGGSMSVYNGQSEAKNLITADGFCLTNGDTYFKIVLTEALEAGDVISVDVGKNASSRGIWITTATSRPSSAPDCELTATGSGAGLVPASTYTVTGSDAYHGNTTFYIYRATGSTTYFNNLKIGRVVDCPDAYAVTYNPNGGTGSSTTHDVSEVESIGDLGFTRTGYDFTGWNTNADGSGTPYAVGDAVTGTLTLYAQWEEQCFRVTDAGKNGSSWPKSNGETISDSDIDGTIYGGQIVYTGTETLTGNDTHGLIFNNDEDELTVTLAGSKALVAGTTITITQRGNSSESKATGLKVNGLSMTPASFTNSSANEEYSQTYTVSAGSALDGAKSFTLKWIGTNQLYLKAINIEDCGSCTSISPTLSAATANLYTFPVATSSTLTLGKDGSTGDVEWSVSPSGVVSVSGSGTEVTVTAMAAGTATVTAFIASDGTHCANTVTKEFIVAGGCGVNTFASVTLTGATTATTINATALANAGKKDSGDPEECYKLGSNGKYFGIQLTGSDAFKEGDILVFHMYTKQTYVYLFNTEDAGTLTTEDAVWSKTDLTNGETIDLEIPITAAIATSLNTNKKAVIYRNSNVGQNHCFWSVTLKRYTCPEHVFEYNNKNADGLWSTTANWVDQTGQGVAALPSTDDRVYIKQPVIVDIVNAQASEVMLDQSSTNTGSLEINAGKELAVAQTVKVWDGSNRIATTVNDIVINSTSSAGLGALVMGSHDGTNKATVNFTTRSKGIKDDNTSIAQYVGTPFNDETNILHNWYNSWVYGITYDGSNNIDWERVNEGQGMTPFRGYCVFSADGADHVYWEQGTLNASTTQTISDLNWQSRAGTANLNNENLLANSWMAPIYIKAMQSSDFVNADATVYIFNSTSASAYESGGFAGNYSSYTVNTAEAVIPAMQSFSVFTTGSGASVKLDYDKIVYQPALAGTAVPVPNKVISRERKNDNEANKLRIFVRTESGLGDILYMWEREDFSEAFENGWDGRKMYGESYAPQLYAITTDGAMAVNCVPTYEGVLIGFRAGTDEQTYTFSFEYDADAEPLYLYDKYADAYTRVLSGNTYQFVANDYDAHARFSLTHYMPGVATGIEASATGDQNPEIRCQKILLNERILILRDGKLYDVTGKTVK